MKKYFTCILLFASVLITHNLYSQTSHSHPLQPQLRHVTPWEVLQGNGEEAIVCYKEAHRNIYLLISGLILVICLIVLQLLRLNRRTSKILQQQNAIIEEKNKNITDSINYAKRLQNAILPSLEVISKALPEHFILYEPKDIVSGDFYWVSDHENKFMVAAIDCTGHGVPGALLSIVGHNAISQTVNDLGITQPDKVLQSMNTLIRNVLHQGGNSDIRDGMDMALCTFDKEKMELQYAGAHNPLYLVRDGNLEIIKASRFSVGSDEDAAVISNTIIQLKKGDSFFIFSDGFADQFGGKDNKKFKTSRFRELLLSINKSSMKEQKQLIIEAFKNWQGNNEQVDDLLVIGVRV